MERYTLPPDPTGSFGRLSTLPQYMFNPMAPPSDPPIVSMEAAPAASPSAPPIHSLEKIEPPPSISFEENEAKIRETLAKDVTSNNDIYAVQHGYAPATPPKPKPAVVPIVTTPKAGPSDADYRSYMGIETPWSQEKGNAKIYWERHNKGTILGVIFAMIAIIVLVSTLFRYKLTSYYWTVFFLSFIWIMFGYLAIWYAWVNGADDAAFFLTFVFAILFITMLYYSLERDQFKHK